MLALGFSGSDKSEEESDYGGGMWHDSSAVIMQGSDVVAAIEEERLNRIKHTNCFPANAIRACLEIAGAQWDDIDLIVTNSAESAVLSLARSRALRDPALPVPAVAAAVVAAAFRRHFGVDVESRIRFCSHHEAHAWSAFAFSGFGDALVLSIDGQGDGLSGLICLARDGVLTTLREYRPEQSLGHFYERVIRLIGFGRFDEFKAMGLAPYGNPETYSQLFRQGIELLPDGDYLIDRDQTWMQRFAETGLLQKARRKGEAITQPHKDLAAALQSALEEIVFHVLRYGRAQTGATTLCLAGGVAHNCTLNGKILSSGMFERMFVQPAAHDAGTPIGACRSAIYREDSESRLYKLRSVYLGSHIGDRHTIVSKLQAWSSLLTIENPADIVSATAELLARGMVVGWVQGRSEFGPRALGNRSIIADPRPSHLKDLINSMVKKREEFRPFAPSVTVEKAQEYFELPACDADLSFMTYVIKVKEQWRSVLGAITHVDGTARLQTVSRDTNERYWQLLCEFEKLSGIPILLNTSFNSNVEPIVDSVEDAVVCYLTTDLDVLVVDDYVITKKKRVPLNYTLLELKVEVCRSCRLVRQSWSAGASWRVESCKHGVNGRPVDCIISSVTAAVLDRADSGASIADLIAEQHADNPTEVSTVVEELFHLWTARMVSLTPRS